ncbi:uncharacterized protein LOC144554617 isoform X1 [Carex rostrata]
MANTPHATSHCEEIKEGYIRVSVDKVIRDYMGCPLPVSTIYVKNLDHAVGNFVKWPKKGIMLDECPQQPKGDVKRCGYYVMRLMLELVTTYFNTFPTKCFLPSGPCSDESFNEVRRLWLSFS